MERPPHMFDRSTLPKFIIGDDGDTDKDFVIHLHRPAFVMRCDGATRDVTFLDDVSAFEAEERAASRSPDITLTALIKEAGDFYANPSSE